MDAAARTAPAVRIKICCIGSADEARAAVAAGADALGLVSAMPSGPGVIDERLIAEIAAGVTPPVDTFLLTSRVDVAEIAAQHRRCRTTTIQVCDRLARGTHAQLREALPGVRIVQVIHVTGPESVDEAAAAAAAPGVDALLLDSGSRASPVLELGGTGRVHDWRLSRRIREAVAVPVFLAGGLRPDNVRAAIDEVGPFAVDVCSGVRVGARLDRALLDAFVSAARS